MKIQIKLTICLLFTLVLFSCKKDIIINDLLVQAQQLADEKPKEALILLDSIQSPESMDKENYMQYIVTRTQAKFKSGQDITNDTIIFEAQKYFDDSNNTHHAALAHFYAGNVYHTRDISDKALESYLNAEVYARLSEDNILTGKSLYNIGYQYYKQDMMDSTIVHYNLAFDCFDKEQDSDLLKMQLLYSLGTAYYANHDYDNSLLSINKGFDLADKNKNKRYLAVFNNQLGVIHRKKGESETAAKYFHTSLAQTRSAADSLRVYLNLSKLYTQTEQSDSAKYYSGMVTKRLSEIKDNHLLANIYGSLQESSKQQQDFPEALRYSELRKIVTDKIHDEEKSFELLVTDKNFSLIQKDKEIALYRYQLYFWFILSGVALVSLTLLFVLIVKLHRKHMKEIDLQKEKYRHLKEQLFSMSKEQSELEAEIKSMLDEEE